jgi:hypothetical protein
MFRPILAIERKSGMHHENAAEHHGLQTNRSPSFLEMVQHAELHSKYFRISLYLWQAGAFETLRTRLKPPDSPEVL